MFELFLKVSLQLGAESNLRRADNPCHVTQFDIDQTVVSVTCPYSADETLWRLRNAFKKYNLGYEQSRRGTFSSPLNGYHFLVYSSGI